MFTIYLAGGMRSTWREAVKALCPHLDFICPSYVFHGTAESKVFDEVAMQQSDMVFVYLEKGKWPPVGLLIEIGYAKGLGTLVVLVNERHVDPLEAAELKGPAENNSEKLRRYLLWAEEWADVNFTDFEAGLKFLEAMDKALCREHTGGYQGEGA